MRTDTSNFASYRETTNNVKCSTNRASHDVSYRHVVVQRGHTARSANEKDNAHEIETEYPRVGPSGSSNECVRALRVGNGLLFMPMHYSPTTACPPL